MKNTFSSTGLRWLWLAALILIADLMSKFWVLSSFELYETFDLLPFFDFKYVRNIGAAFSIMEGKRWLLALIAIVICSVLLSMLYKTPSSAKLQSISYNLIIGGALGNLFDRLYHGFVVDFLHFFIGDWHYPVFNLADVAICVGAGLIIFDGFLSSRRDKEQAKN